MSSDDDRSFREAMRGVKPLRHKPRAATASRTRAGQRRMIAGQHRMGAAAHAAPKRAVDRRMLRDLRRGRIRIDAEADLHGLSGEQALRALEEFIAEASAERLACVRVVHGKGKRSGPGGPVLAALVRRWLQTCDHVLAYAEAAARDGGSGAVYVLLER
jgi:DNA-nicking Smr family endonuclease